MTDEETGTRRQAPFEGDPVSYVAIAIVCFYFGFFVHALLIAGKEKQ